MSNYHNKGRGRFKASLPKSFHADPIKQFLISRGTARDRAVELCCAGKIELSDIPEMTDKLTILHFGQISVDPKVDAEILRIAARCQDRAKKKQEANYGKPDGDQSQDVPEMQDLCDRCADFNVCSVTDEERPIDSCNKFYDEQDAQADAAKQRDVEAEDRQRAEDDHNTQQQEPEDTGEQKGDVTYNCSQCDKVYKTMNGLQNHEAKAHGGD